MKKINQEIVRELKNVACDNHCSLVYGEDVTDKQASVAFRAAGIDDEDTAEKLADLIHDCRGSESGDWVYLEEDAAEDLLSFCAENQLPLACHRLAYDEDGVIVDLQEVTPCARKS